MRSTHGAILFTRILTSLAVTITTFAKRFGSQPRSEPIESWRWLDVLVATRQTTPRILVLGVGCPIWRVFTTDSGRTPSRPTGPILPPSPAQKTQPCWYVLNCTRGPLCTTLPPSRTLSHSGRPL